MDTPLKDAAANSGASSPRFELVRSKNRKDADYMVPKLRVKEVSSQPGASKSSETLEQGGRLFLPQRPPVERTQQSRVAAWVDVVPQCELQQPCHTPQHENPSHSSSSSRSTTLNPKTPVAGRSNAQGTNSGNSKSDDHDNANNTGIKQVNSTTGSPTSHYQAGFRPPINSSKRRLGKDSWKYMDLYKQNRAARGVDTNRAIQTSTFQA